MTWQTFLGGIHIPALRDLPIAYAAVMVAQGGYLLWVVRGWKLSEAGRRKAR